MSQNLIPFYGRHVRMWELDYREGWVPKNWCFWTVVLEKTLESPLDCQIKPVNPKGNQPWVFTGRSVAEAQAQVLWPPDMKSQLIGKDPDAGKDWRQEEKGAAEDEMVRQHHQLNRHESEQTLGDSEGQWSLACCSPWGHKELDTTYRLNNSCLRLPKMTGWLGFYYPCSRSLCFPVLLGRAGVERGEVGPWSFLLLNLPDSSMTCLFKNPRIKRLVPVSSSSHFLMEGPVSYNMYFK